MASLLFTNVLGNGNLVLTVIIGFIVIFLYLVWWMRSSRSPNTPPGPWNWPLIGGLPIYIIGKLKGLMMHEFLHELALRFGKVCSIRLGSKLMVVLSDISTIRAVFQGNDFVDRPGRDVEIQSETGDRAVDLVFGSGPAWKEQRKFFLSVFRGFGVGQSSFEDRISDEAVAIADEFQRYADQPFHPKRLLANATANIVCSILLGKRYNYSDVEFNRIYYLISTILRLNVPGGLLYNIPLLKYFLPNIAEKRNACRAELHQIISKIIEDHRKRLANADEEKVGDFVDAYILEMNKEKMEESTRYFTDTNLLGNVTSVFVAGMETTANTLNWMLLYMAAKPDIQQRIHEEIDSVLEQNKLVSSSDAPNLPYVQAALLEVQRIRPVAPLGAPHANRDESTIEGYTIPANTIVLANVWAIHHDRQFWDNPEQFRPERFLKEQAGVSPEVCGQEKIIPFSIGRRICAGEKIAKSELFLIFTTLLQRFRITLPDDNTVPDFRSKSGLTLDPIDFQICANLRHNDQT